MAAQLPKPPPFVGGVLVVGALLMVVVVAIAVAEWAGFAMQHELDVKVLTRPNPELAALRERETTRLSTYQWVDRKAGVLRIPVERALELMVEERAGQPAGPQAPLPAAAKVTP